MQDFLLYLSLILTLALKLKSLYLSKYSDSSLRCSSVELAGSTTIATPAPRMLGFNFIKVSDVSALRSASTPRVREGGLPQPCPLATPARRAGVAGRRREGASACLSLRRVLSERPPPGQAVVAFYFFKKLSLILVDNSLAPLSLAKAVRAVAGTFLVKTGITDNNNSSLK